MRVNVATSPKPDFRFPPGHTNRGGNPAVKSISWSDSSDRKWLMNHLHWAMNNGQVVRLVPMPESN